jgi:deoxycytidine triphosphate deaminase
MWIDPDKSVNAGVLLSDRIRFYVERVGLIEPFAETNLAPASYDLTLGEECWYHNHTQETGQVKRVLSKGENLIIAPNSIVFVTIKETLSLPFYMVARFNLKLRFLHEGLLVGTGPQVDPGFVGRLSCPLHNFSNGKISLTCGESFAVIEFEKTTPFAQGEQLEPGLNISDIRSRGEQGQLKGLDNHACITFPEHSLNRRPIKGYLPPGKSVSSSVQGISEEVIALKDRVNSALNTLEKRFDQHTGRLTVALFLTVAVVAVSMGTYFYAAVRWHKDAYDAAVRAQEQVKELNARQEKIEEGQRNFLDQTKVRTNSVPNL